MIQQIFLIFLFLGFSLSTQAKVYSIQFPISETKVVDRVPEKTQDFATVVPGQIWTYVFSEEKDYYADYQKSYFAYTWKKAGWDCMRHYEILANGCIPYFVGLEECDSNTMVFLPKDLILEAMHLPGVNSFGIDHELFDEKRYREIAEELLAYTRKHLTSRAMAEYILKTIGYKGSGKILYLSNALEPDYMRCYLLIGLKELLGSRIVDVPKIPHIYKSYPHDIKGLYGKGMSYTKIVDDLEVDRDHIGQKIRLREFDIIIYGSVHRGLRFHDLVKQYYNEDEIFYICGEDAHICGYKNLPHLFIREYEAIR